MSEENQANWPIAAQARPWIQSLGFETFRHDLPEVMKTIAGIGFDGFETALPVLPLENPSTWGAWQEAADGLSLAAAHTGGNWWEPEVIAGLPGLLDKIAKLPDLGCDRVMVSIGSDVETLDEPGVERLCSALDNLGNGCSVHGVSLSIHNHAHELRNSGRILRAIVDRTDSQNVSLGADIGWVVFAGWEPVDFIETFGDRLQYLHVRDIVREKDDIGFIEVGRGDMDWIGFVNALRSIQYNGWLTLESEFSEQWRGFTDPEATVEAQWNGIRTVLTAE